MKIKTESTCLLIVRPPIKLSRRTRAHCLSFSGNRRADVRVDVNNTAWQARIGSAIYQVDFAAFTYCLQPSLSVVYVPLRLSNFNGNVCFIFRNAFELFPVIRNDSLCSFTFIFVQYTNITDNITYTAAFPAVAFRIPRMIGTLNR